MLHALLRCPPGALFFVDHRDAALFWALLGRELVGLGAALLLPDRVQVLAPHADLAPRLVRVTRRFADLRRHRGALPDAWPRVRWEESAGDTARALHLGPVRLGLVADPLAWPWSTHRDACGLAAPPILPPVTDPLRYHRRLVQGVVASELPSGRPLDPDTVDAAVAAVFRVVDLHRTGRGGRVRAQLLAEAGLDLAAVAARLGRGVDELRAALAGPADDDPAIEAARRVAGDPRFPALPGGDLRHEPAVAWYLARVRLRATVDAAALAAGQAGRSPFVLGW